ncbi:MAG: hypothetical protein ACAI34_08825 [Verrucomicrobium sp.]
MKCHSPSPTFARHFFTCTRPAPILAALVLAIAGVASWSPSAQAQSTPLPFDRGVRVEVVASKPAPIRGGDWDDKLQRITLRVKFSNTNTHQSYEGHTATISALGESAVDRGVRAILLQEKIELPLAPLKMHEHACKEVTTKFDKTGAKFGYAYDGWIIMVKDKAGRIVYIKSTSPTFEKLPEKVEKLQPGKCYNRSLDAVSAPDSGYTS